LNGLRKDYNRWMQTLEPRIKGWTPFLEEVNDLMIEEKTARHENDHVKNAEICVRIVSMTNHLF